MQVAYAAVSTLVFIAYYLPDFSRWVQSQASMQSKAFCTSKQAAAGSQPTAEAAAGTELRRRLPGMHDPPRFPAPGHLVPAPPPPPPPLPPTPQTLSKLSHVQSSSPSTGVVPSVAVVLLRMQHGQCLSSITAMLLQHLQPYHSKLVNPKNAF